MGTGQDFQDTVFAGTSFARKGPVGPYMAWPVFCLRRYGRRTGMTETSVKVRATRWTAGGRSAVEESVLEETVLMEREFSLHINGRVAVDRKSVV